MKRLAWQGKLNAHQAVELAKAVDPWQGEPRIELDLSGVTELDAAIFRVIVGLARQVWSWNGELVLLRPQAPVRKLLASSGLDQAVEVTL